MGAINDVVGRARTLVEGNKGLTYSDAVNRAVLDMKASGDFQTIQERNAIFGVGYGDWKTKETKYKVRGRTADNPIPLPGDKSKWVRGRFYEKNGKVLQYGTDFE